MRARGLGLAAALAVLSVAAPASANSRFPESNQLLFSASDPDLVLLRVTFGLLVSHDRGRTFHWVCERSIGFNGIEDPMYAVTPDLSYVGTTYQGLAVTHDRSCSWAHAGGELAGRVFIDLTSNPKDASDVFVFASSYDRQDENGVLHFKSTIWETKDGARTFTALPGAIDPSLLGYTLDVTATDPNRIYLTGVRNPGSGPLGFLLTSRDHGASWESMEVPLIAGERSLFIAGVDPNDAEKVYLRTLNPDGPSRLLLREGAHAGDAGADAGSDAGADAGSDAGTAGAATLRQVFSAQGNLLGFVLSADGSKVYVGGPKDGLHVASTTDFAFEKRSAVEVQCLAMNGDTLWACSSERSGFVAGTSTDDGRTFVPVLRFCDIQGPLDCPAGSPTNQFCGELWPAQKAILGCSGDAGAPVDAGAPAATPADSGGCGCTMAPAAPWGAALTALLAGLTALRRRRR